MINKLDDSMRFHQEALSLRAYRQQVIASNVANADTPGYKARDVDFRTALGNALGQAAGPQPAVPLRATSAAHLQPAGETVPGGGQLAYRSAVQPSVDGNTVDMDVERAHFADNALHYEANLTFISGQLKTLLAAIQG